MIAQISESIGRLTALIQIQDSLKLRKANRIRTIQGSLAIEGNTLSTEQITAILNGKTIIISNPEFGFEQDFKVIQCTKSKLVQNWVNEFFYSIK